MSDKSQNPKIHEVTVDELLAPYWEKFNSEKPEERIEGAEGLLKHKAIFEKGIYKSDLERAQRELEGGSDMSEEEAEARSLLGKLGNVSDTP